MTNRNSRLVVPVRAPSYDGRYWGRYPFGDKPNTGAVLSAGAAAVAAAQAQLTTAIRMGGSAADIAAAQAGLNTAIKLAASAQDVASASGSLPAGGGAFTNFLRRATFEFGTNGGSPLSSTDGIDSAGGGASDTTITTLRAYAGTKSMNCAIAAAATSMGGSMILNSSTNGGVLAAGDELWCRFRAYIPSSWSITTGDGGMKFFRWRVYNSSEVPVGSNTIQLWGVGPAPTGLRTENEVNHVTDTRTFTPAGGAWNDRWVTFEFYIKLLASTSGIIRSWVDGELKGEVTGDTMGGSTSFVYVRPIFLDFFNNGAPQNQSMQIDAIDIAWSGLQRPTNTDAAGNSFIGLL